MMRRLVFFVITVGILGLEANGQDSLRHWSAKLNKTIGTAVEGTWFQNNFWQQPTRRYNKILIGQFNGVVAGNEMKMGSIHPELGVFNFEYGDILVQFAETYDMIARGHTLIWHNQNPTWFEDGNFTRDSLLKIMELHITTIVDHYKGKITEWDVVNEAFNSDGTLRETKWKQVIGDDYIDSAFVFAHRADPDAILILNDYGNEHMNSKSGGMYSFAKGMLERGIPLHGAGFQCHLTLDQFSVNEITENFQRFNNLGLLTNITELDIKIPKESFGSQEAYERQAKGYGRLTSMMLDNDMSTSLTVWAFSDNDSWIPGHTGGDYGEACLYDYFYEAKPAYYAMLDTLMVHNGVELPTGIFSFNTDTDIQAYPNPASQYFTLANISNKSIREVTIYNLSGIKIKEFDFNDHEGLMDISDIKSGVYILTLIAENNTLYSLKLTIR